MYRVSELLLPLKQVVNVPQAVALAAPVVAAAKSVVRVLRQAVLSAAIGHFARQFTP